MQAATSYKFFRLLVPLAGSSRVGAPTIELEGASWTLTDDLPMAVGELPEYVCVSYAWGPGRTANPLVPGRMSDRVVAVLEATIRALHPSAIWIDAFCFPDREPELTACLRSVGAVYSTAAQVVAVLSNPCANLLDEDIQKRGLEEAELLLFEDDPWVSRAWTYQEIVNSKSFCFVAEGGSVWLKGMQFLSNLGCAIERYKKAHGTDSFAMRTSHPRLDNLEDTIADWIMAEYAERTAYQAMSSMDRRTAERPDDYFTALIGAISAEPLRGRDETTLSPAEYFMRLCERKGDFSFIYTSAPRGNAPGRFWRPLPGPLPAIQPWHTFGDGQPGSLEANHLRLDQMCRMKRGPVAATVKGDTPSHILARIRQVGFTGCGEFIELEQGYFFPQSPNSCGEAGIVYLATGLRWTHGGPGLIATRDASGLHRFHDVGVFVGPLPTSGESINLV